MRFQAEKKSQHDEAENFNFLQQHNTTEMLEEFAIKCDDHFKIQLSQKLISPIYTSVKQSLASK